MNSTALVLLGGVVYLGGCASLEATRTRGGGPGADVGNRTEIVRMHDGSNPYEDTPRLIGTEHPSLETARQAYQFSRR
jgi:hypothetical protein